MKDQINLTQEQLTLIASHWENLKFENDYDIHYENQFLKGAIALTEGEMEILKGSKVLEVILPGCIVGLTSLKKHKPIKYQLRVKAGSTIVLVGKSGLNDLANLIGTNVES